MSAYSKIIGLIYLMLLFSTQASFSGEFIQDEIKNCLIWNPAPKSDASVEWIGDCKDGYADGFGTQKWKRSDGSKSNIVEGYKVRGRSIGSVKITYPNGTEYFGEFDDETNFRKGFGKFVGKNGSALYAFSYSGKFEGRAQEIRADGKVINYDFQNNYIQDVDGILKDLDKIVEPQKKIELLTEALLIAQETFGTITVRNSKLVGELAVSFYQEGKLIEAEKYFNILRLGGDNANDSLASSVALYWLANISFKQEKFQEAKSLFEQYFLKIRNENKIDLHYGSARLQLALIYFFERNDDQALQNAQIAISFAKEAAENNPIVFMETMQFYSLVMTYLDKKEQAISAMMDAMLFWEKQDIQRIKQFDHNLSTSRNTFSFLSMFLIDEDRIKEAKEILERYAVFIKKFSPKTESAAEIYFEDLTLGIAYVTILLKEKKCNEAENASNIIFDKFDKVFEFGTGVGLSSLKLNLSMALFCQQKYSAALEAIEKSNSLLTSQKSFRSEQLQKIKFWQSKIWIALNREKEAIIALQETEQLGKIDPEIFDLYFQILKRDRSMEGNIFDYTFSVAQNGLTTEASIASEKLMARILSNSTKSASVIRDIQDQERVISHLNKKHIDLLLSSESNKWEMLDNLNTEIFHQDKKLENLKNEKKKISNQLNSKVAAKEVNRKSVQEILLQNEALIYFYFGRNGKSYSWLITKDEIAINEIETSIGEFKKNISSIRQTLEFENTIDFDFSSSWLLYKSLFKPFEKYLIDKSKIFVVANDVITSIPLNLLVDSPQKAATYSDAAWLFKKYAIVNLPSVKYLWLPKMTIDDNKAFKFLAIADPRFSGSKKIALINKPSGTRSILEFKGELGLDYDALFNSLSPLPHTRREVSAVAARIRGANIKYLFGEQASEEAIRNLDLSSYNVLYFATHALVAGDIIKYSSIGGEPALVLSLGKRDDSATDGLLFSSEIASLKLNAEWVILSACNTGAADSYDGEALSGLARAFIYAGAKSLLVSHWEVNDFSTAQLLPYMFDVSASTLSKSEKLQYAIKNYLKSIKTDKFGHPKYWAPFMVIGD